MEKEIQAEITEAVEIFEQITTIQDKHEFLEQYKDKWILIKPIVPSYYHLQLLSYTESWRSRGNFEKVSQGIANLFHLNLPSVYLKHRSQIIAPANINLPQIIKPSNEIEYLAWFDKTRMLLKVGYRNQKFLSTVRNFIDSFSFTMINNNYHFMKWGAYSGLALEPDWRSKTRKRLDILYRIKEIESLMG
jgi:hypothetical protein